MSERLRNSINRRFGKSWTIGGVATLCRYRYEKNTHKLKTYTQTLNKGTVCINPTGEEFEVIGSVRVSADTFEHVLKPLSTKPMPDWTPQR
ncbi:hypothetical protein L1D52_24115 [Vibrio brasiliensis]|uniref:hypothetical protein n=1 Tax=Vibrio brasiliensis TaxID=170652 RepID=UPI001EFC761F|nr:hypothetical protein [Vibrio brasiliensis]MCG9785398.1 hypothetical protein [Vibrio brasiliensis]